MTFKDIQCICCDNSHLTRKVESLKCDRCNHIYQVIHDVPILFSEIVVSAGEKPSESFASSMANAMSLPTDAEAIARIQQIFTKNYQFGSFLLNAENQFLERLQGCGIDLPQQSELQRKPPEKIVDKIQGIFSKLRKQSSQLRYSWVMDYLPRIMQVETLFTSNIRIENTGTSVISSLDPALIFASYHWRNEAGEIAIFEGHRTPFPIEIQPGNQLTFPLKIETPKDPGNYFLELSLVQEGQAWLDADAKQIAIEVVTDPLPDPTSNWQVDSEKSLSYAEDHLRSLELLQTRLQKMGKSQFKLLEIGGNVHPMLFHFSGDLYNVDVDVHALQIGAMLNQHWKKDVQFICADAQTLPFPDGTFDAIILVSALHHFPAPRNLLESLSHKLQPNGFIATLSEPVGHYYGDDIAPDLLRDLQSGVNEQTFSLTEYAEIFHNAGLAAEVVIDANSLKAFLTIEQ